MKKNKILSLFLIFAAICLIAASCGGGVGNNTDAPSVTTDAPNTTNAPNTTAAPDTTKAPDTAAAPETTVMTDTAAALDTTAMPETTAAPVTEPPVTEPPVTEPPVTEPPVTEPPMTEPPVTEPIEVKDPHYIHSIYELNTKEYETDSHAGEEMLSNLEPDFRSAQLLFKTQKGYYPRIKQLSDGRYMMIFHNTKLGSSIYVSFSEDLKKWSTPKAIFSKRSVSYNGTADSVKYMTPDAVVLENGDIIAVTSYRLDKNYKYQFDKNGIAIRRSQDGGKTWSKEETVYVGTNWEPSIIEAENGEIYLYFTATAPSVYQIGLENFESRSSGVGMIRSKDGGYTWEPNVTGAPYIPQIVMRYYVDKDSLGFDRYNDQMPVALQLHSGVIALTVETFNFKSNSYKFSISYNNDGYKTDIGLSATGPTERKSNLFNLAGPYLDQFRSGEVVLVNHWGGSLIARIGDKDAKSWNTEQKINTSVGNWPNVLVTSTHTAAATIGVPEDNGYGIKYIDTVLNHSINAGRMTSSVTATTSEWDNNTDALFVGNMSQAQMSLRVGHDDSYIYFLSERLDREITSEDGISIYIGDKKTGYYLCEINGNGVSSIKYHATATASGKDVDIKNNGIKFAAYTVNEGESGVIYELAVPKALISLSKGDTIKLAYRLINKDLRGTAIKDYPTGVVISNLSTWVNVHFE